MSTGEYWDEEDEWEEEASPSQGRFADGEPNTERGSHSSLALGVVAMAPLFVAYEYGLAKDPELLRSLSERAIFRLLSFLPDLEAWLRRGLLGVAVFAGIVMCFRRSVVLVPSLWRILLEGALGAVLFGPILALCMRLMGGFTGDVGANAGPASLADAGRLLGGAAFEELLFRVALYGALFVLVRRVVGFFGASEPVSRWSAEVLAVLGSALGFAAFHLSVISNRIGPGGYDWDPTLFTWRALAGVLLALIFRWRGPGVAAWSHGLFNLAVLLGAGPEVFL
jgi:hypothetical protein